MLKADVFVRDQIKPNLWPKFSTLLRTAYAAADELVRDIPILQVKSAQDNKGRIISWAVDFALERAVEMGTIPCECRWRPFDEPTGRYLELRFAHSRLTISQVANPSRQPRNVGFRENARLGNGQWAFDFSGEVIEKEEEVIDLPHILFLHGHQSLQFAYLAVPSHISKCSFLWRSQNLMHLPHEVPQEGPAPEDTDYDLNEMELLKERIERWRKDNGQD
ncbi:hypothetical protein [Rhodobacter sp. NSM]|uniref:hypothetical protein n=1 Tax=Rhodobacter sp. NSM TaxID=3457501 RepID=UPI003FD1CBE2